MKKVEKIARICNAILCLLNIGTLFFGLMMLSTGTVYGFLKWISIALSTPMFFMRLIYLQYILWGIVLVMYAIVYINQIKNKTLNRKSVYIDVILWIIAIIEIALLEKYFWNIVWF